MIYYKWVETNADTEELISALEVASIDDNEKALSDVKTEMETYLEATKEARELERERTDTYLQAMRSIKSDLYVANNEKIIEELNVDKKDITFQSTLTPSSIMNLTKAEIVNIAKSDNVVSVDYNDDTIEIVRYENEIKVSQADAVHEMLGLTGVGINVLLADNNHVKKGIEDSEQIVYPTNVTVVVDEQEYSLDDEAVANFGHNDGHANCSAGIMQQYARNVHIYSPGGTTYSDIEWLVKNGKVDFITVNLEVGSNSNNSYNATAKWYDGLVSKHNIAVVAAAGNSKDWGSTPWPNVIIPAYSFNSIAVGAYKTDGYPLNDRMNNYRYGPTDSEDLPTYKPDLVMAGNTTSQATPGLAGIVAMMLELDQNLIAKPEVIKAILMASCHRKVKPCTYDEAPFVDVETYMTDGLTQKQGAGAVDAFRAMQIILQGNYGEKTITSNNQTATVINLPYAEDINMSIAWSRENKGILQTEPGALQDLELRMYKNGQVEKSSAKTNAGKQLVYIPDASGTYFAVVYKASEFTEVMTYGYAWSTKSYVEPNVEIKGKTAVGQTLTADVRYYADYTIPEELLTFSWQRSTDGTNWSTISGARNSTYTITESDYLNYIRCNVTVTSTAVPITFNIQGTTSTRIVKYGDVDYEQTVSVMDATAIQQYLANEIGLTEEQLYAADVDGDGLVTNTDAVYIQQYMLGSISSFPVENNG